MTNDEHLLLITHANRDCDVDLAAAPEIKKRIRENGHHPVVYLRQPDEEYVPEGFSYRWTNSRSGHTRMRLGCSEVNLMGGDFSGCLLTTYEGVLKRLIREEGQSKVRINLISRGIYKDIISGSITLENLIGNGGAAVDGFLGDYVLLTQVRFEGYSVVVQQNGEDIACYGRQKNPRRITLNVDRS